MRRHYFMSLLKIYIIYGYIIFQRQLSHMEWWCPSSKTLYCLTITTKQCQLWKFLFELWTWIVSKQDTNYWWCSWLLSRVCRKDPTAKDIYTPEAESNGNWQGNFLRTGTYWLWRNCESYWGERINSITQFQSI